ncbi:hypothetical protein EDC01DRAFT_208424 [Geopyxis carbonaria]|nr:hypothetical protein EDC01DRAFT_208424 [Geopyxis carbonaria]
MAVGITEIVLLVLFLWLLSWQFSHTSQFSPRYLEFYREVHTHFFSSTLTHTGLSKPSVYSVFTTQFYLSP